MSDNNIHFDPIKHVYTSNNKQLISVSQLIHCFVPEFDKEGFIARACAKKEGITVEEIKAKWKAIADAACLKGNLFHKNVEDYIKTRRIPNNENKHWVKQFADLKLEGRLQSETILYSLKDSIAGTVDLCQFLDNNTIKIWDFKSNKVIQKKNKYKSFLLPPFQHIPNINFEIYSLQLNLYAYLMEQKGYWVEGLALLHLNPENEKLETHKIRFMPEETKRLVKFAKNPPRHEISIQKQQEEETEEFF